MRRVRRPREGQGSLCLEEGERGYDTSEKLLIFVEILFFGDFEVLGRKTFSLCALGNFLLHRLEDSSIHPARQLPINDTRSETPQRQKQDQFASPGSQIPIRGREIHQKTQ